MPGLKIELQVLGRKQVEMLNSLHDRDMHTRPLNNGKPILVLRSLAKRGLVWIERRRRDFWHGENGRWADHRRDELICGLTAAGRVAVNELHERSSKGEAA